MLRYALRRLLWVLPSVLAVSLVSFYVLTFVPPQPGMSAEEKRERFYDLPRFVNVSPVDLRARVDEAVARIVAAGTRGEPDSAAAEELRRLGGAALPVLLPKLDELGPSERDAVVAELAPLAGRMGIASEGRLRDSASSVVFWNRLWESRGVDFEEGTARSAVQRYARYGTEARARQLRELDTYVLPYLFEALEVPDSFVEIERARRLVEILVHVTDGAGEGLGPGASVARAKAVVQGWQRWWLVHETDYQRLSGARRVAAFVTQTQYGKWVYESVALGLAEDNAGRPLWDELARRAKVTGSLLGTGLLGAYALSLILGSLAALRRGTWVDRTVGAIVLVPYAASPALLAVLAARHGASTSAPWLWAVVVLSVALMADPTRHQRDALLPVLASEHVRAAVARGMAPWRVVVVHGTRNAAGLLAARLVTELPLAVTAVFVLERALSLPGLGDATIGAVARRDVSWLMAMAVWGAIVAVASLVVSDVAQAVVDPRLRQALLVGRRRAT